MLGRPGFLSSLGPQVLSTVSTHLHAGVDHGVRATAHRQPRDVRRLCPAPLASLQPLVSERPRQGTPTWQGTPPHHIP